MTETRARRTRTEMAYLRAAIRDLAEIHQPCTVRQIYYLGIGQFWLKDTGGRRNNYKTVVRLVGEMREADQLPWGWIADNTRWVRQADMFRSKEDALEQWASAYRRDAWASQARHVEVWCESDSIAGVILPITYPAGIGLYVCRGQSSKTQVYEAVETYAVIDKPVTILYVGDWDPTGLAIPASLADRIDRYGHRLWYEVALERIAVTPADVRSGELVSHEVNTRDTNYPGFRDLCLSMGLGPQTAVEVEALPPDDLRQRLDRAIDDLIDNPAEWAAIEAAEASERDLFFRLIDGDTSAWEPAT